MKSLNSGSEVFHSPVVSSIHKLYALSVVKNWYATKKYIQVYLLVCLFSAEDAWDASISPSSVCLLTKLRLSFMWFCVHVPPTWSVLSGIPTGMDEHKTAWDRILIPDTPAQCVSLASHFSGSWRDLQTRTLGRVKEGRSGDSPSLLRLQGVFNSG